MEAKTISKQLAAWFIAIVGIFSLTACDEDWWNGWDGYSDVTGQWRIVEVSGGWNVLTDRAIIGHFIAMATLTQTATAICTKEVIGVCRGAR